MIKLIILALALTLSANQCEIAKADHDRNEALFNKLYDKEYCYLMVRNLEQIRKECKYSAGTNRIIGLMIGAKQEQCGSIQKVRFCKKCGETIEPKA